MRLLIAAVAIACFFCVEGRGQELRNPSFEEVETEAENMYGDLAAGWGRWGHWMNRETDWKPCQNGKCLMGYHHWQIESNESSGFYQDVADVPAGADVTFGIHVYLDGDSNPEWVEVRLEAYEGGRTLASEVHSLKQLKKKKWEKLSVSGRTEGEGVRVLVQVQPANGERKGAVKFDTASLSIGR